MNWKPSLKISRGARLALLAVLAVLLPTAILSIVQYRSLMDLQDKTKVVVQENLRQTLQSVSQRVKERLEDLGRETLGAIDLEAVDQENFERIERQLTAIRQAHPEIDRLLVVAYCSCHERNFAVISKADGITRVEHDQFKTNHAAKDVVSIYEAARAVRPMPGKPTDFFFDHTSCTAIPGEEKKLYQVSVFSDLSRPRDKERLGFAGMTVNSNYMRDVLLPGVIPELLRGADAARQTSALAFSIFDITGQTIYSNQSGQGSQRNQPASKAQSGASAQTAQTSLFRPEVKMSFSPVYRRWELGIGYQDTTIEGLARNQFRQSLLLTGFVLALLLVGIVLTLRTAAREVRLAQAKTTFVSNVSHELKTPLALIRLFAETLELDRVKSPEKAHEYYRIIHHESRRLTSLINNILDFSKIEAGRREYQFADASVSEVVAQVLGSYEYQLLNAGFELKTEIKLHLPPASIDRDALAQAVLNLLNNAAKYSAETKEITVRVEARENQIAIEVADRGIGIPRAEHEKIFEKFYRVSTGLVHDTKGSGLGLALVKHIIEAHRGRILVESVPGQGSCFTILLPISKTALQSEPKPDLGGYQVAENPHH